MDNAAQKSAFDRVLEDERDYLKLSGDSRPWALCLSGGGIRSATFSLGVLQGLAKLKLLSRFHYLSTVSGGGYIGSWLSRWMHESKGDVAAIEQALGASIDPVQVRNLRAYSNYLSPVWGLSTDFFTLVSIFLRNLLLNWAVLLPLLAALVLLPRIYLGLARQGASEAVANVLLFLSAALVAVGIGYVVADLPSEDAPSDPPPTDRFALLCFAPIFLAAVLLGLVAWWDTSMLAGLGWFGYAIAGAVIHVAGWFLGALARTKRGMRLVPTGAGRPKKAERIGGLMDWLLVTVSGAAGGAVLYAMVRILPRELTWITKAHVGVAIVVPGLLLCFWLATTVYVALARAYSSENDREWWARSGAWWLRGGLGWLLAFGLVIHLPPWLLGLPGLSPESLATGGGLGGLVIGLIGYWSKNGAKLVGRAQGFAAALGTRLLDLAALAFIVILLVVVSLAADYAIEKIQPCATCAAIPAKPASAADVELAARAAEATARSVEATARYAKAAKDAEKDAVDPALKRGAEATDKAALALSEAAANMRAGAAETMKAAETAARTSESLGRSAQAAREAGRTMNGALEKATDATVALAGAAQKRTDVAYSQRLLEPNLTASIPLFLALAALGLLASFGVGVNTFSLHGMYGNRLVRAYLGGARPFAARKPHWFTGFDFSDNLRMKELKFDQQEAPKLLHVVNVALNLVGSAKEDRLEWQQRKAESFTISPLHSGGGDIGFRLSAEYSGDGGISLGRAMTMSGAAASSNMGYHSSSVVAFAMTFFNIRLGWWLPNPSSSGESVWTRSEPRWSLQPLLWEAFGLTSADKPYVYLSDGGHFENLGLYEMVNRRCERILVVDASADPKRNYDDLQEAMRKIRVDFGISIEFPQGAFDAPRRCIAGRIKYAHGDGDLCYLKPVICGNEPLDVLHYADESRSRDAANPFPHQSTTDQFFNESQFESYRMLGLHTVRDVLGADEPKDWPKYPDLGEPCGKPAEGQGDKGCSPKCRGGAADRPKGFGGDALSGLSSTVQSMGQGALVATAITVGGVLGVSGTVALRDSSVSLSPGTELKISKASIDELAAVKLNVNAPGGAAPEDAEIARLRNELRKVLDELAKALGALNPPGVAITRLTDSLNDLGKRLDAIKPGPNVVNDFKILVQETSRLSTTIPGLSGELRDGNKALDKQLVAIQGTLDKIESAVSGVPPRRNIRGVE